MGGSSLVSCETPCFLLSKLDLLQGSHALVSHCCHEDPEGSGRNGKAPKEASERGGLDGPTCPRLQALTWKLPTGVLG